MKKSPEGPTSDSSLTHNPFAKLATDPNLIAGLVRPSPSTPARREPTAQPPSAATAPAKPGYKVRMRLESKGRSGKVVTRVMGLPTHNLDAIASHLRKSLGCGAVVESEDVLLQGSLVERASQCLDRAGDLRNLRTEPAPSPAVVAHPGPNPWPEESAPGQPAGEAGQVGRAGGTRRSDIRRGQRVAIVLKADQDTGKLTEGVVRDLLTSSPYHPRGIKVRLETGEVGRVKVLDP